jgi:hypothetical protein
LAGLGAPLDDSIDLEGHQGSLTCRLFGRVNLERGVQSVGCGRRTGSEAPEAKHRRYEIESGLICGILPLMAGIRAASYFFLVYLYGVARVRHDHLRFTAMPKGSPWIVSNGDRVSNGHFLHYLIGLGIWMALFLMIYPLIFRLLPQRQGES